MTPYTLYTMPVSKGDYDKIVNFCVDKNIENISDRENMYFELQGRMGYHERVVNETGMTFLMNELELVVTDAISGDGNILVAIGVSPSLEELFESKMKMLTPGSVVLSDEPLVGFVISNEYDGDMECRANEPRFQRLY